MPDAEAAAGRPLDPPYEVRLHPAVRGDLARIADGLARHSGRAVAERKLEQIAEVLRSLARTPHRGTIRNEIAPGLRAIPAAKRGVIVFAVDDDGRRVLVKAIVYAGSDWIAPRQAALREANEWTSARP